MAVGAWSLAALNAKLKALDFVLWTDIPWGGSMAGTLPARKPWFCYTILDCFPYGLRLITVATALS